MVLGGSYKYYEETMEGYSYIMFGRLRSDDGGSVRKGRQRSWGDKAYEEGDCGIY